MRFFFDAGGFAFFDVFVANDTALFGQNRRDVRIPDHQLLARLDLFAVGDEHAWHRKAPCTFPARGPWHLRSAISPLRFRATRRLLPSASFTSNRVDVVMLDGAAVDRLDVVFDERTGRDAAGVERTHRELRARLADRLSAR